LPFWADECLYEGTRKKLHERRKYTKSAKKQSQSEQNKSATSDHVNTKNHIIDWDEVTIVGQKSDQTTQWIREPSKSDTKAKMS